MSEMKSNNGIHGILALAMLGMVWSVARIKADYDMIKNRNFLSYGPVESGRGAE